MFSDKKDQEVLDANSGCAKKPCAISKYRNEDRGDESNAPDASEAKTLTNEDKAVGSTTARDAPSHLIAPSQEENSNVGGSQEDVEDASEANNLGCARKPGAISEADGSNAVDTSDAKTLANEDKPVGSTTASDAASSLIAPSQEENSKVGGSQEDLEDASEANKTLECRYGGRIQHSHGCFT